MIVVLQTPVADGTPPKAAQNPGSAVASSSLKDVPESWVTAAVLTEGISTVLHEVLEDLGQFTYHTEVHAVLLVPDVGG